MGIYRSYSQKDAWISNRSVGGVAMTGSNHGESPSLNIFAFKSSTSPNVVDVARTLIQFDVTELSGKIFSEGVIPTSNISYILKMYNMLHEDTVPSSYDLIIFPLSRSWDEGLGIDDDNDRDFGVVNWIQPVSSADWALTGSDFLNNFGFAVQHFDRGDEDLEVDITDIIKNWLTGAISNNGLVVMLSGSEELNGDYFRKAFHSRETKYIDRIPYIEARWNNTIKDNRDNFVFNQTNSLYLYNIVRGAPVDLIEPITVRIQDTLGSASQEQYLTASRVSQGVYSASFSLSSIGISASWHDIWYSGSVVYMTGTFVPTFLTGNQIDPHTEFDVNIDNLRRIYSVDDEDRLIVHVRNRDWVTHVGVIGSASLEMEHEPIERMYYSVVNDETGEVVIPFGTGSYSHTQLSYNGDGNYFNLDMKNFIQGFKYRIKFLIINNKDIKVVDEQFFFKVV